MASAMTPEQQRTIDGIPGVHKVVMWGFLALVAYRVGRVPLRAEVLPNGHIGAAWTVREEVEASGLAVTTCKSKRETSAENPR